MKRTPYRRTNAQVLTGIGLALVVSMPCHAADGSSSSARQRSALARLQDDVRKRDAAGATLARTGKGNIHTLYGKLSERIAGDGAQGASRFLLDNKDAFKIKDVAGELKHAKTMRDPFGLEHVQFDQVYGGIPVYKRRITVHLSPDHSIHAVTGNFVPDIDVPSLTPAIDSHRALQIAKAARGVVRAAIERTEQVIYYDETGDRAFLAYAVTLADLAYARTLIIDAATGKIVRDHNNLYEGMVNGTGIDALGAPIDPLRVYQGTDFPLPSSHPILGNVEWCGVSKGPFNLVDISMADLGFIYGLDAHFAMDLQCDPDYIYSDSPSFGFPPVQNLYPNQLNVQRAGVSAQVNLELCQDYYHKTFQRKGIDNAGMPVVYLTQAGGLAGPNAQWNWDLKCILFYPGDALADFEEQTGLTVIAPTAAALDVVAHEYTHGVTTYSSGLLSGGHAGALNESLSDMFGYLVEAYHTGDYNDWTLGEDMFAQEAGAKTAAWRSLADPAAYEDPDHISHPSYTPPSNTADESGVHTNCGIPDKVFYLLVHGGTHYGIPVAPLSPDILESASLAGMLFYACNTGGYFAPTTNFFDAAWQTLAACAGIFPGDAAKSESVRKAWESVGIPIYDYAEIPYAADFNTASLDAHWKTTTNNGKISFWQDPEGSGNYKLILSSGSWGLPSNPPSSSATLYLYQGDSAETEVSFRWKRAGNVSSFKITITDLSSGDELEVVRFSPDASGTWHSYIQTDECGEIVDSFLSDNNWAAGVWHSMTLDLDALAVLNSVTLNHSVFAVTFKESGIGVYPPPSIAIDDVKVCTPGTRIKLPYSTSFENGAVEACWRLEADPVDGDIWLGNSAEAKGVSHGLQCLCAENLSSCGIANAADLALDLSGEKQVEMSFWLKMYGPPSSQMCVKLSDDEGQTQNYGTNFFASPEFTSWKRAVIDISASAADGGLELTNAFAVKFAGAGFAYGPLPDVGFAIDKLAVYSYKALPYSTGFEKGFDSNWAAFSTGTGQTKVVQNKSQAHQGSYSLSVSGGSSSSAEALMHLNLAHRTKATLDFYMKCASAYGVYFSNDGGATFVKLCTLIPPAGSGWQRRMIDIAAEAAKQSIKFTQRCVIKFQNEHGSLGSLALDDLSVY